VPDLLRACVDVDVARSAKALSDLDNLLYHQGGWVCSAATAALPFLLDLVDGRAVAHRHRVVELICLLAEVGATAERRFVDPGWIAALASAQPRMLAVLADQDPQVRREAMLLAVAGHLPDTQVAPALWLRWRDERDRVTRRDLVLAFGKILARDPTTADIEAELIGLIDDQDVQLRFACVRPGYVSRPPYRPRSRRSLLDRSA
jgi:hypothetical protein